MNRILSPICYRNLSFLFLLALISANTLLSQTYNSSAVWTCPNNVYSVTVQIWGPGGKGGTRTTNGGGGGGGGGAFVTGVVPVVPGNQYDVFVGTPGNDSWFGSPTTALAKTGNSVANNTLTGGIGGLASACVVPVGGNAYNGGNGFTSAGTNGGGGGAAAGTSNAGANATSATGAVGTNGGGSGGDGVSGGQGDGLPGVVPGGGGGGGKRTSTGTRNGGAGANGRIILIPIPKNIDLVLTKTVNNSTPSVGDNIIFTLTATNNGPDVADNVKVIDDLPDGYSYVSDDGGVSTTESFGLINWNIGTMASGASSVLHITVTVLPPGTYQNTANIYCSYTETDFTNNHPSVTPVVTSCGAGYKAPILIKN